MVKDSPPSAPTARGPNRIIIARPTLPALARWNLADVQLSRHLGFEAVDQHRLLTRA
jgi:hypothetical protein